MSEKGNVIIKPHQILSCPKCLNTSEFLEHVYQSDLNVILSCPKCPYKYSLNDDTQMFFARNLPKRDPRIAVMTSWIISTNASPEQEDESTDQHSLLRKELNNLPPEIRTRSVQSRIDEVASMLLVIKRVESSIRYDFRDAIEAFVADVNSALSPYAYLRGCLNLEALACFFEQPFMVLPFTFSDERLQKLARVVIAPYFYQKVFGIPIGNGGGFTMQLVCPYSDMDEPAPLFLRKILDIPEPPSLEMLHRKLVGNHLPYCWKDIPGIEEDVDHSNDHPSVRIKEDQVPLRTWLVQWGIKPWKSFLTKHDQFFESRLEIVKANWPKLYAPLQKLVIDGRLMFAHRIRADRLRFAGAAIQSLERWTILIHGPGEKPNWDSLGIVSGFNVLKSNIVMMPHDEYMRGDYHDQAELVIAEADQAYSPELLPYLYRHEGRLLLLTGDPLFDVLEYNQLAPLAYGLVNRVHYDRENFLQPRVWKRDSAALNEKLVQALRQFGFVD